MSVPRFAERLGRPRTRRLTFIRGVITPTLGLRHTVANGGNSLRTVAVSLLCLTLAACATVEPVPAARPLSQASIAAMGPTPVSVTGNGVGVGTAWDYTEMNGAGAGLAGAIGAAIASAIVNAAPSARAHRQASELARVMTPPKLDASMVAKVTEQVRPPQPDTVTISDVTITQKPQTGSKLDDIVEVISSYTLSEDSSVLRVISTASYMNAALPYKTPYAFKSQPPSSENTGPLYRNTFSYYSTPLPVPTLTPELKARLVASVREAARDENGSMPAEGSREFKALQRDIALAEDDKLSAGEISVFLTREWLKDNGALLKQETDRAHGFVAKYLVLDLNRTAVPSLAGTDELVETTADDRTVRRIGAGVESGAYVSSAGNVTAPATFGTAIAVGKATTEYVNGLKAQPTVGK